MFSQFILEFEVIKTYIDWKQMATSTSPPTKYR